MNREKDNSQLFPASSSLGHTILWIASVAVVYFATARLSLSMVFQPEGIAAIWPPEGIFLSAILLTRRSARPPLVGVLFITDLIAEMLTGTPFLVSVVYALALAGDAVLSSWLLNRFVGEPITFRKVREVVGFLFFAVILSNGLMALVTAAAANLVIGASYWDSWKWWAASDGIGNLVVTPLILSWASLTKTELGAWNPKRLMEGAVLFVSLVLLNHVAFTYLPESGLFGLVFAYLSFPFLLWAALRFGMRGVTLALIMLAAISIRFTLEGRLPGISVQDSRWGGMIIVHLYLVAIAIPSLILAAVMNERRQAEKKILESQNLLRAVVEGTTDAVYVKDLQGCYLLFNTAASRFTGKSEAETIGNDDTALFPSEEARTVMEGDQGVIASGKPMTYEENVTTAEGKKATFLSTKGPIVDERGNVTGLFGIARDITEQKRAEERVAQVAQEWRRTFDSMIDAIWIMNKEHLVLQANTAAERIFHRPIAEIEGRPCWETVHGTEQPIPECPALRVVKSLRRESVELQVGVKWFEVTVDPFIDDAGHFMGAVHVVRDITARRGIEVLLRENEERMRVILDSTNDGFLAVDASGKTIFSNRRFAELWRIPQSLVDTGDDNAMLDFVLEQLVDPDGFLRKVKQLYGTADIDNDTIVFRDGRIFERYSMPIMDDGSIIGRLWSFRDITDKKQAEEERERLQLQLQQAMKMEAIGRLAGGVAHDFNNLLTVIIGNVSLALAKVSQSEPVAGMLSEVNRAAERAARLTQQLLAFSRKQIIEPKVLDLNALIVDLHEMLVRLIGENIELKTVPWEGVGMVKVDPGQFEQILVNLAVNARDAMPDGGRLTIETSNVDLDDLHCAANPDATPGRFVLLSVSDTGHGMTDEVKAQIFDPFFTTKPKGSGTGLGLSMTHGAVKQAGGSIAVDSEVGKGTTVMIYLPRVEEPEAVKAQESGQQQELLDGTETVLLVEDEDVVRNLCVRILERLGYRVMQASNGDEAISLAKEHMKRIDLLMTDVVMPGMSGKELAEQLALLQPGMKILFTSGYTDNAIVHHGVLDEGVSFIGKPYSLSALAKKVRDVLDKA